MIIRSTRMLLPGLLVALAAAGCDRRADAAPPAASAAPDAVIGGAKWRPGTRYAYRFELKNRSQLGPAAPTELTFRGALGITPRELAGGRTELYLRAHDTQALTTDNERAAAFAEVGQRIEQPFSVVLSKGIIDGLRVSEQDAEAANVLRVLASALQVAESGGAATEFAAEEYDSTGRYLAEYQRDAKSGELIKRKVRYEALTVFMNARAKLPLLPKPSIKSSEGRWSVNDGTLGRVKYREEISMTLEASLVTSTSELLLELEREEPAPAVDWALHERTTRALAPSEPYTPPPRADSDFDPQRIGDFTFETALAELERLSREEPDRSKRQETEQGGEQKVWVHESQRAFVAMAAILRSRPKHLPQAASAVRRGSLAASSLGDALSAAGTDQAQAVLVALIRDKSLRPALRYALGVSLVRTERASEPSLAFITESTGDPFLRELAVLGLGTVSRRLREAGLTERAQRADAELASLLAQAKDDDAKVRALRGIGNSGQELAFERVEPLLVGGSVRVRAAAVEALRLMKDPRVDAAVARALGDREAEVRGAGLNAAEAREPSELLAQGLQRVLQGENKSGLRGRALRLAGRWLPKRPELRASLERVAEADESPAMRAAARKALERGPG